MKDHKPLNEVDFTADEVSKPQRDIKAITETLIEAETNDRINATIGVAEADNNATFVILSHEQDVADFDHRISFIPKPRKDGWTRLYMTGIGNSDLDQWEVVSMPYNINNKVSDMRDFAGNGWMIACEFTDENLTHVDQKPEK